MSYGCADFVDYIAAALGVALDAYDEDDEGDLQKLAGYALDEIARLQAIERAWRQATRHSADPDLADDEPADDSPRSMSQPYD